MRSNVHFIMQGKGGIGKSFIATVFSQFLIESDRNLLAVDTDPLNKTLAGFKGLHAHEIHLMNDQNEIDSSLFDALVENLLMEHEGDSLIDNGASSFIRLSAYLLKHKIIELLCESGKGVVVHIPIAGGQELFDTLAGMEAILNSYPPEARYVIWLNEFKDPVENDGKSFEAMKIYQKYEDDISGVVKIPMQDELHNEAVKLMMKKRMTFSEVHQCKDSELFGVLKKRRIEMFKEMIWGQLHPLSEEGVL